MDGWNIEESWNLWLCIEVGIKLVHWMLLLSDVGTYYRSTCKIKFGGYFVM